MKMRAIQIIVMNRLFLMKTVNMKLHIIVRICHKLQKCKIVTKLNIFLNVLKF